jgi:hypothetical protein
MFALGGASSERFPRIFPTSFAQKGAHYRRTSRVFATKAIGRRMGNAAERTKTWVSAILPEIAVARLAA